MSNADDNKPELVNPTIQQKTDEKSKPTGSTKRTKTYILLILLWSAFVAIGGGAQTVSAPLWSDSFSKGAGGPYFILVISSLIYTLFFLAWMIIEKRTHPEYSYPSFRKYIWIYLGIGFFDALNGLLVIYASPSKRTPPMLQSIFPNLSIFYSMITTRILIKKKVSYCRWQPIVCLIGIMLAVMVSLLPQIIAIAKGEKHFSDGDAPIVWAIIFMIGVAPGAIYNVFQEKFLSKRSSENIQRSKRFDLVVMLFWGCLIQLLVIFICFWVDVLPWYGFSPSISEFGNTLGQSFSCFFNSAQCQYCSLFGMIFNIGYTLAYVGAAKLNEESANYNMIASMLGSPLGVIFWAIFPQLTTEIVPWWSFVPAILLFMGATILWKFWEKANIQNKKPTGDEESEALISKV